MTAVNSPEWRARHAAGLAARLASVEGPARVAGWCAARQAEADRINAYWSARGFDVGARVCPQVGVVSDLINGLPPGVHRVGRFTGPGTVRPGRLVDPKQTPRGVLRHLAHLSGVPIAVLKGPLTTRHVSHTRFEAYARLRALGLSLPRIGEILGGRDHTTVRSGLQRHAALAPSSRKQEVSHG